MALDPPVLVFDGDCAFCSRSAAWIAQRWTGPVHAIGSQHVAETDLRAVGLSRDDVQRAAYWIDADGRAFRGHRAVAHALLYGHPADRVIARTLLIPPMSWLARGGYWLVARYRHRLPGATPACRT